MSFRGGAGSAFLINFSFFFTDGFIPAPAQLPQPGRLRSTSFGVEASSISFFSWINSSTTSSLANACWISIRFCWRESLSISLPTFPWSSILKLFVGSTRISFDFEFTVSALASFPARFPFVKEFLWPVLPVPSSFVSSEILTIFISCWVLERLFFASLRICLEFLFDLSDCFFFFTVTSSPVSLGFRFFLIFASSKCCFFVFLVDLWVTLTGCNSNSSSVSLSWTSSCSESSSSSLSASCVLIGWSRWSLIEESKKGNLTFFLTYRVNSSGKSNVLIQNSHFLSYVKSKSLD